MRLLGLIALAFSAQAFACPNLAGSYTCTFNNQSEAITITQDQKDGVTIYQYNGGDLRADNQVYSIPDDESLKQATVRGWCEGESLKINVIGKYYSQGSYFGDLNMTLDNSKVGDNLRQITSGNVKNDGGNYPINADVTCTPSTTAPVKN